MALYDARCSVHGDFEAVAPIAEVFARGGAALACPETACDARVEIVITSVQRARIDDSENVGSERKDSTKGVILGLPGRETIVGQRANGKAAIEYRPMHASEMPTRRAQVDYAKRHGLSPADSGRYRTTA